MQVGMGGMAHVWAARHRGAGVIFALKMLRPHLAENASFRDMFFDEARVASRIRHENVARTYELVDLDGVLTLVMEFVDGSSLVHMLRPSHDQRDDAPAMAIPYRHAVKMVGETCAGLHAAHELTDDKGRLLEVVHRDVSPHNILLTKDGKVKITDFGVAKALGKSHVTIAGQVKGKLAYMSPEQLVGGGIDRRSDVFSLGSVLYEATTGQRPFLGDHDPQVMSAIIMGNCVPPSAVVRNYPRELEQIVMRALATDPDARFSTALQLRQALEGWLAKTGPQLGSQQIAVLLEERCGAEIAARMSTLLQFAPTTSVPAALAAPISSRNDTPDTQPSPQRGATPPVAGTMPPSPPSRRNVPPPPASSATPRIESGSSAMEVDQRRSFVPQQGQSSSLSIIGGVLAVLVGLGLGLGVLAYVRAERRARAVAVVDASTVAVVTTPDAGAVTNAGDIDDTPPTLPKPPPRAVVRLTDLPAEARVFVDGVELPAGTSVVPRPDAGESNVLVKADGKEDAIFAIHPSDEEISVVMKDKPHRRPKNKDLTTVPPNPYD